ncbi:hypothetical protein C7416_104454 [Cupriavidus phytorum]|uniref:Uncharacterized protein n=1 Tax=Cupriavidus phytorum TaxID=3024399 RepID=A0A2W7PLK3_9BURK|nr:hypothetical protein [Cupriavidus alkaliphilus]PZX29449.1 hypothetical protein C7416_104454 [Cupriavidus alkaliphilus]
MKHAFIGLVLAMTFVFLLSVVTPWLINQRSSLTMAAVPFLWLAFAGVIKFIYFKGSKQ